MSARSIAVVLLWLISWPALADQPSPEARAHFAAGDRAYKLGDFPRAAEEFQKSYELFPSPLLLFDLAQSNRKLGRSEKAVFLYRRYLAEEPNGRFGQIARQMVDELERELPKIPTSEPPPTPPIAPPSPAPLAIQLAAPPSPAIRAPEPIGVRTASKPVYKRWWLWTTVGVVVAGAVVGVAVGVTLSRSGFHPNARDIGPGAQALDGN